MFESRGYLLDLTHRVPTMRTMQEIVDLLARCRYTEFRPFSEDGIPPESLDMNRLGAYCEMQGVEMVPTDRDEFDRLYLGPDTICASTEAPRSLAGRVEEMRERMERAEAMGRGRRRFLVTDFSDGYSWQPLVVSLPGIILGGSFAASGPKAARMDLERELNGALGVPLGGLVLKLGTLYLRGGAMRDDASEYFNILSGDHGYSRHPGLTQAVLDDVSGIVRGVRVAAERWTDRSDWAKEIAYAALLLDCACHRRSESMLRELRDLHGHIWRMRFAPEGRVESLSRLPRF